MDHWTIEYDHHEAGVCLFLAVLEARRLEDDVERLPFAGGFAGVDARRGAVVDGVVFRLILAARIDAAAIATGQFLLAEAVEDLDFVQTHQLDAGVRFLRDEELDVNLDVGEFLPGDEIRGSALDAVDEDALARFGDEQFGVLCIKHGGAAVEPIFAYVFPILQGLRGGR